MRPTLLLAALLLACASPAAAQADSLAARAEAQIRAQYEAWNAGDVKGVSTDAGWLLGFGVRTRAPRGTQPLSAGLAESLARDFFASVEHYRVTVEALHVVAHGDVVVAWGVHTESFKPRDGAPEELRVRFSQTLLKQPDGSLRTLLSHRDAQPFDADGRYIVMKAGR